MLRSRMLRKRKSLCLVAQASSMTLVKSSSGKLASRQLLASRSHFLVGGVKSLHGRPLPVVVLCSKSRGRVWLGVGVPWLQAALVSCQRYLSSDVAEEDLDGRRGTRRAAKQEGG